MKVVGLISGGKDSVFNLVECVSHGHEIVALATLLSQESGTEMDSYMYQTVGVEIAPMIAQAMELPFVSRVIQGTSINQELYYEKAAAVEEGTSDEVEDLYQLLVEVKQAHPEVQAVASGAIFSNYQRLRVENVCQRLGLVSLSYLWLREQDALLQEMIESEIDAKIVKTCSLGLKQVHLGKSIA